MFHEPGKVLAIGDALGLAEAWRRMVPSPIRLRAVTAGARKDAGVLQNALQSPGHFADWRSQGESNPCFSLERAAS
jgi:hypothetical protein